MEPEESAWASVSVWERPVGWGQKVGVGGSALRVVKSRLFETKDYD